MFEELYEPLPDVSQTLKRIGLDNYKPRLDVESLNNLIRAFKSHIPFENLSIWYERKVPSLAPADLYDKMVVRRRGGYCFELNGLFYYLLKAIGFNVYSVAVFIREDLDYLNDLGHRANICIIDGRAYFTEVGYGGSSSPDYAIPLDGETTGEYFIREEKKEYTLYRIVDKDKEIAKGNEQFLTNIPVSYPAKFGYEPVVKAVTSKPIEMFRDYVAYPVEFYLPNIAISLNPDSKFVKNLVVNFRNDKGEVYSIYNDQFTSRTINGTETHQIQNLTELKSILSEHFDIKL